MLCAQDFRSLAGVSEQTAGQVWEHFTEGCGRNYEKWSYKLRVTIKVTYETQCTTWSRFTFMGAARSESGCEWLTPYTNCMSGFLPSEITQEFCSVIERLICGDWRQMQQLPADRNPFYFPGCFSWMGHRFCVFFLLL